MADLRTIEPAEPVFTGELVDYDDVEAKDPAKSRNQELERLVKAHKNYNKWPTATNKSPIRYTKGGLRNCVHIHKKWNGHKHLWVEFYCGECAADGMFENSHMLTRYEFFVKDPKGYEARCAMCSRDLRKAQKA